MKVRDMYVSEQRKPVDAYLSLSEYRRLVAAQTIEERPLKGGLSACKVLKLSEVI